MSGQQQQHYYDYIYTSAIICKMDGLIRMCSFSAPRRNGFLRNQSNRFVLSFN